MAVRARVHQLESDRWQQVEDKHSKVSPYFDAFGQIKPQYRRDAPLVKKSSSSMGWLLQLVAVMVLAMVTHNRQLRACIRYKPVLTCHVRLQ